MYVCVCVCMCVTLTVYILYNAYLKLIIIIACIFYVALMPKIGIERGTAGVCVRVRVCDTVYIPYKAIL